MFVSILALLVLVPVTRAEDPPKHKLPTSPSGNLVVGNCDGESWVEVQGKKAGEKLSVGEAQEVSRKLMEEWKKKNPGKPWIMVAQNKTASKKPAEDRREIVNPEAQKGPNVSSTVTGDPEGAAAAATAAASRKTSTKVDRQEGIYSTFTAEDQKIWDLEQTKLVVQGKKIFHSGDLLRSKTAISCDMCHPDGSNTHPQTYPKFQVQLQRVALLRDMINWCIENPVKGVMLKDEDPDMRALEAYITWQHRGLRLEPGKH